MVAEYKKGNLNLSDFPEPLAKKIKEIEQGIPQDLEAEDKLIDKGDGERDDEKLLLGEDTEELKLESSQRAQTFFKRPLISRGFTKLKRIWNDGGKKNERLLFNQIREYKELLAPLFKELITSRDFLRFMEHNNYKNDLNDTFMKAVYMYFNGIAKIKNGEAEDVEERQLSKQELRDIYNSINVYRFHVFIESIIKYRKKVFRDPVIND